MPSARILLADENPTFRDLIGGLLASWGHEVVSVPDGEEALRRISEGSFDLLLADSAMPRLDGLALAARVRRRAPEQEIILFTSRNDVNAAVAALKAGASDYLLKPVSEDDLAQHLSRSLERTELRRERAALLNENLQFLRNQALLQRGLEMLSTLDLERLQEACLVDLCGACDAQSGALWVLDERGGLQLRAYRGLIDRGTLPARITPFPGLFGGRLEGRDVFAVPGHALGKAFHLPLRSAGELGALVQLSDRLTGEFSEADFAVVRAVGDFAATALRNARRFAALERRGLRDPETGAYSLAYFVDYAGKEFYKARRYGRVFSVVTLRLDGLDTLRESREDAGIVARAAIGSLGSVVRDSDVVAKASEDEFHVMLPETDSLGALMFARRARQVLNTVLSDQLKEGDPQVAVLSGTATFPRHGSDLDELLHASRARCDEARYSLARSLDLSRLDFWSAVDLLLGNRDSPKLPSDDRGGPTRRGFLPEGLFLRLQGEMALEIARDPRARGLLYVGCREIRSDTPAVEALEQVPADCAMRVYLMGRRSDLPTHSWATPVFLDGDDRIARHEFVFLFCESATYALVQRASSRGPPWGFHTSDAPLVDELVAKLQERYDLQPL